VELNDGRLIDNFCQPYFIAEMNTSHFGDLGIAMRMVDMALEAGCDCVKFQSWSAESLYSKTYYKNNPIARRVVDKFSFSLDDQKKLSDYARMRGVAFSSTPYSREEVDFLVKECAVPFVKIASMEINNYSYLEYIGKTGSAILLSTGMADAHEIQSAVDCIESTGNRRLCILHCVSVYPAAPEIINLNNMPEMRRLYPQCPIGYSDHTIGLATPVAAVALGAAVIEKHFTLDASRIGMDNQMAMEPGLFADMVTACKTAYVSLGNSSRSVLDSELAQRVNMRRSIVSKREIARGGVIGINDIDFKRPGDGFSPGQVGEVVGRVAIQDIGSDEVIYPSMIRE